MLSYTWWVPTLPLLTVPIIVFFTRKNKDLSSYVSIGAIFSSFLISCAVFYWVMTNGKAQSEHLLWFKTGLTTIELSIVIDQLSAMMMVVVSFVSLMIQIYSRGYMRESDGKHDPGFSRYYAYLSLFTFSMLGLVLSNNFLQMYIFWELVGVCSYLLIGYWYHKPSAAEAGKKAFITTRVGDVGFMIGILLLFKLTGSFGFEEIGEIIKAGNLPALPGLTPEQTLTIIALLVFCGAVGKSAQFPLHVWLPDAMEGPTPVSALIHAATMVAAGVYLVGRLFGMFFGSPDALLVVAYIGGFTAIFAATIALTQNDIKRIIAYSTLSQLGYMMLALGVCGYTAGLFHLMTHAFFKALLFLCAGSVIHAIHTNDIWSAGGLFKPMKITATTFVIAALSLAGIPPLSGFWSKDEILISVFNSGNMVLFSFAIITVFLTAFYIFRLFFVVFMGKMHEAPHTHHEHHIHESPAVMTIPLILLAILSIVAGLVGSPLCGNWIGKFIHFEGLHTSHSGTENIMYLGLFMACLGIFVAWVVYGAKWVSCEKIAKAFYPFYQLSFHKYWVDELYEIIFVKPLHRFTKWTLIFDLRVIDGLVNGVAWFSRGLGMILRILQTGLAQSYMLVIILGIVCFLVFKLFG
ncbi:MAG: NADH-quinone oxidoreductase subunit L [bacterium]